LVNNAELVEQRMQDHATRLVALDGFVVSGVDQASEQLDQVELLARVECCPRCGEGPVVVKERPVVGVCPMKCVWSW